MMMNDTFSITRFGWLFKKTILERYMQIVGTLVAILVFTFLLYALVYDGANWRSVQRIAFMFGFVGGGVILSSIVFSYFNTNASGAAYLTLPSSALEKWLCGVLIAGLLFCVIFLTFFRSIDYFFITAYRNSLDRSSPLYATLYNRVSIYTFDGDIFAKIFMMYANFAGAMMVGSLYFNRVALVKVALIVCGVLGAVYFFNLLLANLLFDNVDEAFPYATVLIKVNSEVGNVELPRYAHDIVNKFLLYVMPSILWLTAYVRLREKEI